MRVMFAGDIHGNTTFCTYLIKVAQDLGVDRVVQVGDFGYWEHDQDGVVFLNKLSRMATRANVPWVFIDGNHDNVGLLRARYTDRDSEGFISVRENVSYAPRGHRWAWDQIRYAAFGGAYSVDKPGRLRREARKQEKLDKKNIFRRAAGVPESTQTTAGTLWFPEEEATDAELGAFLADTTGVDVLVTHDKPRGSSPSRNRKSFDECLPNQDRIQEAVRVLQPELLVHGHLHYRYQDFVRISGDAWMRVEGLGADDQTRADTPGWRREDAWMLLEGRTSTGELNLITS